MTADDSKTYSDTLKDIAAALGIPLPQFFDELRDNMVSHPITDLSQYLVDLSNNLEAQPDGASQLFDTRIRSAAIMLETLEGRALAYADENEKLQQRIKELESNFKELAEEVAPRVQALESAAESGRKTVQVSEGYEYHVWPNPQMHKGGYELVLVPEGGQMYGDEPGTWGEGVIVKRLWDEARISIAEPMAQKGTWKITSPSTGGSFESRLYLDKEAVEAEIRKLGDMIDAERLTIRNQQIALDAKDQRILEMEEENNSFQEVQRDRAKLLEENKGVLQLRERIMELEGYVERLQDANQQLAEQSRPATDESRAVEADSRALRDQNKKLRKAIKALI